MENSPNTPSPAAAAAAGATLVTNQVRDAQTSAPPNDSAMEENFAHPPAPSRRTSRTTIVLCTLAGVVLTLLIGVGVYYWYFFHGRISPTELSQKEQVVLGEKLEAVTGQPVEIHPDGYEAAGRPSVIASTRGPGASGGSGAVAVAAPVEIEEAELDVFVDDNRTLILTEREINGFLHHNTPYAEKVKIDLGKDTITAKIIVDFPEDTPMVGGRRLRVHTTMAMYLDVNGELAIELRDVSAGGISIPNAWLGDLKNKNLTDFGDNSEGSAILEKISAGIADFEVEPDQIRIRLNE
jgi:hypothetical protein